MEGIYKLFLVACYFSAIGAVKASEESVEVATPLTTVEYVKSEPAKIYESPIDESAIKSSYSAAAPPYSPVATSYSYIHIDHSNKGKVYANQPAYYYKTDEDLSSYYSPAKAYAPGLSPLVVVPAYESKIYQKTLNSVVENKLVYEPQKTIPLREKQIIPSVSSYASINPILTYVKPIGAVVKYATPSPSYVLKSVYPTASYADSQDAELEKHGQLYDTYSPTYKYSSFYNSKISPSHLSSAAYDIPAAAVKYSSAQSIDDSIPLVSHSAVPYVQKAISPVSVGYYPSPSLTYKYKKIQPYVLSTSVQAESQEQSEYLYDKTSSYDKRQSNKK